MIIQVRREHYTDRCTIGELSIDGIFECYTMEPRKSQLHGKPYCIPSGTYTVIRQPSLRFHMATPHLLDVPGFTNIEIHPGNFPGDTEGCTLLGKSYSPQMPEFIGQSRAAFDDFMAKLLTREEITYLG